MNPAQLARLHHQPEALDRLIDGLSEAQLRQQPQPGTWSIGEQIAHLGRYQHVFADRLQRISSSDNPTFERYVADDDADFPSWLTRTVPAVLTQFHHDRARLTTYLTGLTDEQIHRQGHHPTFGWLTIEGWTEFFLLHEAHHLLALLRLATRFR